MTDDRERSLVRVAFPAGDPARDGVALVTLDRPEARNALSFALLEDLDEVLAVLDDDDSCRAIVITGAGERAFAAGADIRDLASSTREQLRRDDPFACRRPRRPAPDAGHRGRPGLRPRRRLRARDGLRHRGGGR